MSRGAAPYPPAHAFFFLGIVLCCATMVGLTAAVPFAQESGPPKHFFPLTQGTCWAYQGTVDWSDQVKRKTSEAKVSLKMTVERVFEKEGTVFAVLQGYPADLNFSAGDAHPSRWVLTETSSHGVFLRELDPGTRLSASGSPGGAFDSFMTEDNLLFEWPLARGRKYCDAESAKT